MSNQKIFKTSGTANQRSVHNAPVSVIRGKISCFHLTGISQMDYSAALKKATKFLEVIRNGILIEFT